MIAAIIATGPYPDAGHLVAEREGFEQAIARVAGARDGEGGGCGSCQAAR
jgi:hypothetical protein